MRKRGLRIGLFGILLWLPLAFAAQQIATVPVTIRVSDQTGARVVHAQVSFAPSPDNFPAKAETDETGRFSYNLKPGGYALSVSSPGFKTWAERIIVGGDTEDLIKGSQLVAVVLQIANGSSPGPIYPQDSLVLTADPYHAPVVLSPADFHALPHISITVHNAHTDATETYSGVPLATLLEKVNAPLGKELHGEAMTSYLISTGSDGYAVVLSLAEVDPSFHAGQVLVVDARDGQPLGKNGPFQLIVSDDKRPARWVRNLVSITLQQER
jgi:hypothetical protein